MTTMSVFGASPPPGSYTLYSDGSPSIRLAQRFYRYGGLVSDDFKIVGGRIWLPSLPSGSTQLKVMLWLGGATIATAPTQQIVVDIAGTGWNEARFTTPQDLPADGTNFCIAYEFAGNDDNYVFTNTFRADAAEQPQAPQANGLAVSELISVYSSPAGGAEQSAANFRVAYGIDVLVENGPPPEPDNIPPTEPDNIPPTVDTGANRSIYLGQSTTLTAVAADTDGTVASVEWFQVSGPPATLFGLGSSRTFTPAALGTYVFAATATDDDGATSAPNPVTVTVVAVPVEPEPEPEPTSTGPAPFGMIERAIVELLETGFGAPEGTVGGDLSYDAAVDDYYIWIGLVSGSTDAVFGEWTIDIDVFDNRYGQAMERALALEAFLLKPGGHRTSIMRLDSASQNEVPMERPWGDDNAYRVGASYTFVARRSG